MQVVCIADGTRVWLLVQDFWEQTTCTKIAFGFAKKILRSAFISSPEPKAHR